MSYNITMTLAIDTLEASEVLKEAGFKKSQAKALIQALSPHTNNLVTNEKLDAAINKLKAEIIVWMVGLHIASISLMFKLLS